MQAICNLVEDVQRFVTFVDVGLGGRLVQSIGPKGSMTELDNSEDLMIKVWTCTATGDTGLVAGALSFSRVNWRAVFKFSSRGVIPILL